MPKYILAVLLALVSSLSFATVSFADTETPIERVKRQCKSLEGRAEYINTMDEITRRDLGYQAQGLGISYDEYLANSIEEMCVNIEKPFMPMKVEIYDPNYGFYPYKGQFGCTTGDEDDRCDETYPVQVPAGHQACKLEFEAVKYRSGTYDIEPAFFYPDDPNIARFKGWIVRVKGRAYENKTTGVMFKNVKLWVLPDHYTDEQRRAFNCERPMRPSSVGSRPAPATPAVAQPQAPRPSVASSGQARVELVVDGSNRNYATLIVSHVSGGPASVYVEVTVKDAAYPNFPPTKAFSGTVSVEPGKVFTQPGLHQWHAVDWKVTPGAVR